MSDLGCGDQKTARPLFEYHACRQCESTEDVAGRNVSEKDGRGAHDLCPGIFYERGIGCRASGENKGKEESVVQGTEMVPIIQ